jgi:hypothetical protein
MNESTGPIGPDPELLAQLKGHWLALMEIAVWGDIKSDKLGATGKLRKRVLDLGERLKSIGADRDWIPHQRERLKNLLGSCLSMRDTLLLTERTAQDLTGGADLEALTGKLIALHTIVMTDLQRQENLWAQALQSINQEALGDNEEAGE